jgi:DNA polymerase delta subunit 1
MMLESSDPRPVITFARQASEVLSTGKVPVEKLMMSKQLGSEYKVPMPHVSVRNKIRARAPGSEPQQGDRVAFVIVKGPGKMYEKAEDPTWVTEKGLKIDYSYYFTNQFKKPVADLLEPLIKEDLVFDKKFLSETNTIAKREEVKVASSSELDARKSFLKRFALKVSTV